MPVFQMPSLGADMEDGTLVEWLVKPGDTVCRGDIVAVVETQKGAIEVEIFEEGVVKSLDADIGAKLPVGSPLATIEAAGKPVPARVAQGAGAASSAPEVPSTPPPEPVKRRHTGKRAPSRSGDAVPAASPAARQFAAENDLDLSAVAGSGPEGAIVLRDLTPGKPQRTKSPTEPDPARGLARSSKSAAMAEMRKAIAAAMQRSNREIPQFQVGQTIDIEHASNWLAARNIEAPPAERILLGAVFMKAAALAASRVEGANGHFGPEGFLPASRVNLGVAIALRGGGLVAPAIPDADTLTLPDLMAAMKDLVGRARAMRLRASELTGGTFTVSSLGDKGPETMTGIIFPPQVALLAVGAPQVRPWIVADKTSRSTQIAPRRVVTCTLSADHRVSDGRQAAKFLTEIEALLQTPEAL